MTSVCTYSVKGQLNTTSSGQEKKCLSCLEVSMETNTNRVLTLLSSADSGNSPFLPSQTLSDQLRLMSMPGPNTQLTAESRQLNIELRRNQSELLRAECEKLLQETNKSCKRMKDDDNKRLDQRVRDIQFLKSELELKLEEIIVEIDVLLALQSRVVKTQEACKEPLRVTLTCVEERRTRLPAERLPDEVDKQLLKEKEVLGGVIALLQRTVEQMIEQIRLLRSAKYGLEKDLKDKFEAGCIDSSCVLMTTHSLNNSQRSTNTKTGLPSFSVTPQQWENISDIIIAKAEQQKTNSMHLRALVESLLEQTTTDMQKQIEATSAAFWTNAEEIKRAKSQMEDQLTEILSEFASQKKIKEDLQVAITENEHFLNLAQAKLDLRRQRPFKEQCHDPAQASLLTEVQQLTAQISKLHEAVAHSEAEQRALLHCQQELQENIELKAISLYTDEVVCSQHREPIVIYNFSVDSN